MQIPISVFQRHPTNIVFHKNPKSTSKCLRDILPWVWYAQHNLDQVSYKKMRSNHEYMYIKHHIININKTHIKNSITINPTHIWTSHFSNLNNNSKTKKSKAINMKYFEKNKNSIPFLEVWRRDDEENGGFLRKTQWVCERDEWTRQWTVTMSERKLKSF